MAHSKITEQISRPQASLSALTAAALVLPGLLQTTAHAAEDDEVDFQYSHYQEGKRDIYGLAVPSKLPQNLNPIEVDSIHGSGRFTLTDRIKFAFNYTQDTWSGATPIGTSPMVAGANYPRYEKTDPTTGEYLGAVTGASPFLYFGSVQTFFTDKVLKNFYQAAYDPSLNIYTPGAKNNQLTHVLSYASPETRKQGDFKLSYAWDEAALDVGGGISIENDYESRFASLGGHFDFNQKQTTINWGVSYTNSDTAATLDPDGLSYYVTNAYDFTYCDFNDGKLLPLPDGLEGFSTATAGYIESTCGYDQANGQFARTNAILRGNRQDWGSQLGLTQVLDKNSLVSLDMGYTRSTGYLSNPYKVVYGYEILFKPGEQLGQQVVYRSNLAGYLEIRPDERNLFNWHLGYDRYIEAFDAALHFDYSFAHDDWSINAHTFEADWVQPLGAGWAVTPRIRYYSQSSADFYTTGIFRTLALDGNGNRIQKTDFPEHYSSDQRLSGFGTLSGGVTLSKQFAKGISLETGFEYYTHQGSLKIGGGGEQAFADFDYWVANAALKVKLDALNAPGGGHNGHGGDHHHSSSPAGVMFDHALPKAGDFMAGYRFMRSEQARDMLFGSHPVSLDVVNTAGCGIDKVCAVTPEFMAMNMHMLDLMYAPTDWLTLMLMPQWMDMEMTMTANPNFIPANSGHLGHTGHAHQTGGIGDFGMYALFKAFDHPNHHLTLSLGGTAPTGDVDIKLRKTSSNPVDFQPIHYGMQLGSGTWDFKPALTYTGEIDHFLWGAQANATVRLEGQNKSGYRLGDIFQGSVWGGYHWTNWLATTVRGVYTWQDSIKGRFPTVVYQDPNSAVTGAYIPQHIGPFDFPGNYGGQFVDLGLGVNVTVPSGAFAGNSLKFEWLQPVHTDYNGYQLDRNYAVNFTWSYGF